ncbi:MAG: SPOR domain-containing protein [Treponema sp.]|nr:SPOR domain-containing protein [Treponema sp.]
MMQTAGILGSINHYRIGKLFAIILFLAAGNGYAQNPGLISSWQLGAEILELEGRLSQPRITASERHEALVRLARLRQLSGDLAGAAENWLDAAAANQSDDAALVAGAYCLAAIGEWERALWAINPLLASGRQGMPLIQAHYLDASLRARITGDVSLLASLADNPLFAPLHPLILYTLWRITDENPSFAPEGSAQRWESRLRAEFPQSPEARASSSGTTESIVQGPIWMLFPGMTTTPSASRTPSAAPPAAMTGTTGPVLQTGVFSREANAQGQAEALRRAGFTAFVTSRMVNGVEHWAVTVPAGQDSNRTSQELTRAGFDSFLVRN